EVVGIVA
ncbi:unnamed protein product, partial [Parascedosporium putredinis]